MTPLHEAVASENRRRRECRPSVLMPSAMFKSSR